MPRQRKTASRLAVAALVVTAVVLSSQAALGGGTAPRAGERVAFFQIAQINAFAQAAQNGVKAAAKKMNASVDVFDANFDASKQISQMQDAMTTGRYKAFVIFSPDGNAVVPMVKQAIGKGIKVTAVFTPLGPNFLDMTNQVPGVSSVVGESERQVAQAEAKMTINLCKGKNPCNVVYMPGLLSFPPSKGRRDVYMKAVGKVKSIKIVAEQEAQFAADPAVKAMQNILQAQSDIDVVATDGDQMTFGAEQAIKSAGRKGIALTGNGGGKLGLTAIRAGRWYGTVYSKPYTMGYKAAEYAIKATRGQKVPKQLNLFVQQAKTDTGPIVTKRNVRKVTAQWTG